MRAQAIITITVITIGVDFFFIIFHLLQNSLQHLVVVPSIANHKSQNSALVADNVTYVILGFHEKGPVGGRLVRHGQGRPCGWPGQTFGRGGGTRTRTGFRPRAPEARASAIPPRPGVIEC